MMPRLATLKDRRRAYSLIAAVGLLAAWMLPVLSGRVPVPGAGVAPEVNLPDLGRLPISFEPNAGQTDPSVRYMAHAPGGTLYFTPSEVVLSLSSRAGPPAQAGLGRDAAGHTGAEAPGSLRIQFQGSSPSVQMRSAEMLAGRVNYLIGSDPSKWQTGLPTYAGVSYSGLYPGIDLAYDGAGGTLKGTYTLAPGADPGLIRWRYSGAESLSLDHAGNLAVRVSSSLVVVESAPVAWQETGGGRVAVAASYAIAADGSAGFVLGSYNPALPLVIDPAIQLPYSTYLGGGGADSGTGIAVDGAGNAYVTGRTASTDFPTLNQYQADQPGYDAFVTKLNTNAGVLSLVYSTYLGGNNAEEGRGIAVDGAGNAYVTGATDSTDFPTLNLVQGDQPVADAFVTKLSPAGSALVYSTYLGGGDNDYGNGIAVDGAGNAYVAGHTESTNFPLLNPYQGDEALSDAFVTKLTTNALGATSLVYSTYLGGSSADFGYGIAVDGAGNAYVAGETASTDFPTSAAPFQGDQLFNDAFVTRLNTNAGGVLSLVYSTYLGGSSFDSGNGIAVDGAGNAYVTGNTLSNNFPTLNPVHGDQLNYDAFVTKLNTNAAGSALVYSTYLGGSADDFGNGIAVDGAGNAYVTGHTSSINFPILDQYQGRQAGIDAFVTRLNTNASGPASLVYSTYLGGNGDDYGYGIAVDMAGNRANAYVTGYTDSTNFPIASQYQSNQGGEDAFVARLAEATNTSTPLPTATITNTPVPAPTNTPVPAPTNTTIPAPTNTPVPAPTNTPAPPSNTPVPTGTPVPLPTNTPVPAPTNTPVPVPTGQPTNSPVPAPTNTPVPAPTNTPVPAPSNTPVPAPTSTPCPITFTDVQPTDYFYEPVRYLYCRGVISGYADNTFRPYAPTTRGQLVKIIVLAEGFPITTPAAPTFSDVPPENVFYPFVETAAARRIVSGYSDGTFRPFNNVTRGQLCKIIVVAEGWPLINPPNPRFTDVPPENPFYSFIETAAARGIISGYADGTFRWGNNATRGQISKIVYLAVTGP